MFNLLASAFMSFAAMIGGLFGAHASSTPNNGPTGGPMGSSTEMHGQHMGSTTPGMGPGVMGLVTSIDGTTLIVDGKAGPQAATTTYTVDASSAKVIKQKVGTSTVSSIAQGDHVMVQGSVSGTSITAKLIIDGIMPMMGMDKGQHMGSSTRRMAPMQGGQGMGDMPGMAGGQQGPGEGSQGGPSGQGQAPQGAGQ